MARINPYRKIDLNPINLKKEDLDFSKVSINDLEVFQEFKELVFEVYEYHFCSAADISQYIKKNKLGFKYKNLAGDLTLRRGDDEWVMKAGIAPEYYRYLCEVLQLNRKKHPESYPVKFVSYKDLPKE